MLLLLDTTTNSSTFTYPVGCRYKENITDEIRHINSLNEMNFPMNTKKILL